MLINKKYKSIIDYLNVVGNKTFEEFPFNDVDVAILEWFTYGEYKCLNLVNLNKTLALKDVNLKNNYVKFFSSPPNTRDPISFIIFVTTFLKTKRYSNLKILDITQIDDKETQFCAFTFKLNKKIIVCFRGTDKSIAGWKEDLLLGKEYVTNSQNLALEYIKNTLLKYDKNIYIAGHSKGGNMAYYAFFNLTEKEKDRIIKVYNFDGNGFRNDNFDYLKYKDKLLKIVPHIDVVGIIYDSSFNFKVVHSTNNGVLAHDILSWSLDKNYKFNEDELTPDSEAFCLITNEWLNSLNDDNLDIFLDFIFKFFDLKASETLDNLKASLFLNMVDYINLINQYPKDKKDSIKNLTRSYILNLINKRQEIVKRRTP